MGEPACLKNMKKNMDEVTSSMFFYLVPMQVIISNQYVVRNDRFLLLHFI